MAKADDPGGDLAALRAVTIDYLDGMFYADEAKTRAAFHPLCRLFGHSQGTYETDTVDQFVAFLKREPTLSPGTPYVAEICAIDITGDIAVVRLTDTFLGTRYTDYLTMAKDAGRWQIVNKAFFVHADS